MRNIFPSMTGLRAFEAAARHRSFTRAAIELNLTQSAVSHQIRKLEELLNVKLFDRIGNEIQVTEAGSEIYNVARAAIAELRLAMDRATRQNNDDVLTIGALGTFAMKCLIPHLKNFTASNPDIQVRLKILPTSSDAIRNDCDVAMLYGVEGDWPGYEVNRITTEELFPVCSPSLLDGPIPLNEPKDLTGHVIIRTVSPLILRDDWPFWLRRAGISDLSLTRDLACDLLFPSFQLAIEGLGVALGRSAVVRDDIISGKLVEPFSIRLQTSFGYHLVYPANRAGYSKVAKFISWARDEFSELLK
ncbi:LysR substrate-binding domain-containing protein [Sphingobium sp.]|uniref:LysR substrate-binding domain-containing protein n=1 Tax=Sphingobium sp. TaxID=1912891 RepID=UPI00391C1418